MKALESAIRDISPDFVPNDRDARFYIELLKYEATPAAITFFAAHCRRLTDYGYWFALGTLWVSYTGWSDLELWKSLFRSPRPNRVTSLMKPSELRVWQALPESITAYRAHRPNESDWISYAIDPARAAEFALRRGVYEISEYRFKKSDALCLFLRREETEVLLLDRSLADFVRVLPVEVR